MNEIKIEINNDEEQLILKKRTENLSKKITLSTQDKFDSNDYFLFSINNINYAIEKLFIEELHLDIKIKKIPKTPSFIRGISNIRGEIVSINDISTFLGGTEIKSKISYRMIRVRKNDISFGIIIDDAVNILTIGDIDIQSSKKTEKLKYIKGIINNSFNIIDMDKVFADPSIMIEIY